MDFEYDPEKSQINKSKHGIDFDEAKIMWEDPDIIEFPAKVADEPRFLVVGKIEDKHWSGVVTYRQDKIRIISVRRAREEEVKLYES